MTQFYTDGYMTIRNLAADELGIHPEFITVLTGRGVSIKSTESDKSRCWVNTKNEMMYKKGETIEDEDIIIRLEYSYKDPAKMTIGEIIIPSKGSINKAKKFLKYTLNKLKEMNEDTES